MTLTDVQDNFKGYDGPDWCPWMEVDYTFATRQYGTTGTDRLFIPAHPFSKGVTLPRGKRQNDLVCKRGGIDQDRIRIRIPEGYTPESLPKPVSLDTEWGTFTFTAQVEDDAILLSYELRIKRFRESPDRFDDFRTFFRAVNKAYQAELVLVSSK